MIDDIELSPAYATDLSLTRVTSNTEKNNVFGNADKLSVMLKNNGSKPVNKNIKVTCLLDGDKTLNAVIPAEQKPLLPGDEYNVVFPATDLSKRSSHTVKFMVDYPGDEVIDNNTLTLKMTARQAVLGNITAFKLLKNETDIVTGANKIRVIFYTDDIFRIWMAPGR